MYIDDKGWLQTHNPDAFKLHVVPTPMKWTGMHALIKSDYDNHLMGTCTHYDALPSAERTARGFSQNQGRSASTHIVIDRHSSAGSDFADIYVLASVHDRTWHAGLNLKGGDVPTVLPNGVSMTSPNQWLVGIDLSNWGLLKRDKVDKGKFYSWPNNYTTVVWDGTPRSCLLPDNILGHYWESYSDEALNSYLAVMSTLIQHNNMGIEWHYRHSDLSPKRKLDPGPAFPFRDLLEMLYSPMPELFSLHSEDHDRMGDADGL